MDPSAVNLWVWPCDRALCMKLLVMLPDRTGCSHKRMLSSLSPLGELLFHSFMKDIWSIWLVKFNYKGNILKTRVAYWELEFAHHGLQKLWGSHSTSSCLFHQSEVGPLTMTPCRNRIRVATLRLHWWRGPCNLPLVWAFGGRLSDVEVDLFRFFLICKFIQRYIQVIIANWLCKVFLLDDFKNYLLRKCVCLSVWKVILQGWIWEDPFCLWSLMQLDLCKHTHWTYIFYWHAFATKQWDIYSSIHFWTNIRIYKSTCI